MAIIKKPTNNKGWRGCGEKGILLHCWWECKLVESSMEIPQKLKIELPYDLAIPVLSIYREKTIIQKDTCTLMFTDRGMDKNNGVYIYVCNGILLSHKKNETMCIDLESITFNEISQRQIFLSLTSGI